MERNPDSSGHDDVSKLSNSSEAQRKADCSLKSGLAAACNNVT